MKEILLPTINEDGEYIDVDNFEWAHIFKIDSINFVHCFIDKELYFLFYSVPLERWFKDSGVHLVEFGNVASGGRMVAVSNIPERYWLART